MTARAARGLLAVALVVCTWPAVATLQQPATEGQPGVRWNEDQIRQAVAPVRVGRKLTPKAWPNGAKVAVCISFDVDYEGSNLAQNNTLPVDLSARQYGAVVGLPRILDLLDRHDIPASFYFASVNAMLHPESVQQIQTRPRHEIGLHGWMHENLVTLNDEAEEQRLLDQSIALLTKLTGKRPAGWRAPSWAFSKYTLPQILKAGFLYDSSMMGMDEPYEIMADGKFTGLVELPVDWILDDAPYFSRTGALPSPELIFQVYREEFDLAYAEGTYFMLTLHPYVSGHRSRIVHLDKLLMYLKSKPGVWFATAEQIANYVKQNAKTD